MATQQMAVGSHVFFVKHLWEQSALRSEFEADPRLGPPAENSRIRNELNKFDSTFKSILLVDEEDISKQRAVLFGRSGTPYDCGVFVFDIFLPHNYPFSPPVVKLAQKRKRWELLHPGVFLNGELDMKYFLFSPFRWGPKESIGSMLLALQNQLFKEHILRTDDRESYPRPDNRPGDRMSVESIQYNGAVRKTVIRLFILDAFRCPPFGTEDVVNQHLVLNATYLRRYIEAWFPLETLSGESTTVVGSEVESKTGMKLLKGNFNGHYRAGAIENMFNSNVEVNSDPPVLQLINILAWPLLCVLSYVFISFGFRPIPTKLIGMEVVHDVPFKTIVYRLGAELHSLESSERVS